MVLTTEEQEITNFFRDGATIAQLSEVYGYTKYRLKKLLAYEDQFKSVGYIWRSLGEKIPPCPV